MPTNARNKTTFLIVPPPFFQIEWKGNPGSEELIKNRAIIPQIPCILPEHALVYHQYTCIFKDKKVCVDSLKGDLVVVIPFLLHM
ncbi:MAG: hypothetical protein AYK19_03775 [Theionarchaea archaeon DG-70-1]|nr:MAG: hypothetical protein AYK19_03775 [Theionarchaea archaeon DG-70-1]